MSGLAPDHAVRLAALEPSGSFILEAPAGSGKTDLLAARFLRLLSGVESPRQILALTYTRKAADEMLGRILGILDRARRGDPPRHEWDGLLLESGRAALANPRFGDRILENPEAYRVGTFHSFCASVVRGWPLEAGVAPGSSILEDLDQQAALEAAVEGCFRRVASGAAPDLLPAFERRLAACDNRLDALTAQVVALLAGRDRLIAFGQLVRDASGDLEAALGRVLEAYVGEALGTVREHFAPLAGAWAELARELRGRGGAKAELLSDDVPGISLGDLPAWQAADVFLTQKGAPYHRFDGAQFGAGFPGTPSAGFIQSTPEAVAERMHALRQWPPPGEDPAGIGALADILALAAAAGHDLQAHIPGRGLDYLELELAALRALRWRGEAPAESLLFFGAHLRHVLVDEAQDMNDVQARLLGRLLEGWEPGDGRTLFVVGDPKQSIYRFRRAEVALFDGIKREGLVREGEPAYRLRPLDLTANFRSEPGLVAFNNALFQEVMALPRAAFDEVVFKASSAARDASGAEAKVRAALFVKPLRVKGEEDTGPTPREREAAWVAGAVDELRGREPEASIAVLFPARTALDTYVRALARRDIPLRLLEGEDLAARPEVRHLRNLFTALARPVDDVAWAGALRAPWCRLPSNDLVSLGALAGPWSRRILGEAGKETRVSPFAEAALVALRSFGREPYERTLGQLWEDLGGPEATASYYGAAGVANARAFLDLLSRCSGFPSEEALERLDRLMEKAYTPPDPAGAFSRVEVMTVHRAKGLEFDHVFAVNLDRDPRGGGRNEKPAFRLARFPVPGRPVVAAATEGAGADRENLAYRLLGELDEGRGLAESLRLFYVACTRARRSLTLTGTVRRYKDETRPSGSASPLAKLWRTAIDGEALAANQAFAGLGLEVLVDEAPAPPKLRLVEAARPEAPMPFDPEPLPYLIRNPSERAIEEETGFAPSTGEEEHRDPHARARGVVLHRLLQTLALGGPQPSAASAASALEAEGLPREAAASEAPTVLAEAGSAWAVAPFARLREGASLEPEWGVEDVPRPRELRAGRIDLLIRRAEGPCIVDYKTGRPAGDPALWLEAERARYRPQLRAYAEMVGRVEGLAPSAVKAYLLFTATGRLSEI